MARRYYLKYELGDWYRTDQVGALPDDSRLLQNGWRQVSQLEYDLAALIGLYGLDTVRETADKLGVELSNN